MYDDEDDAYLYNLCIFKMDDTATCIPTYTYILCICTYIEARGEGSMTWLSRPDCIVSSACRGVYTYIDELSGQQLR